MMRGITKQHCFFPKCGLFRRQKRTSSLGPHGANAPHLDMHMREIVQFFKTLVSFKSKLDCGWMVPTRPLGHLQEGTCGLIDRGLRVEMG